MPGFDAEWYLRQLGENSLLGVVADEDGELADLKNAAAALVAVGAIEPALARAVVGDYGIARAAREGGVEFMLVRLALRERGTSLKPPPGQRVVGLSDQIELPEGTLRLRYAILDEDHTTVCAVYTARERSGDEHHMWVGRPSGRPSALSHAVLADEQGTTAALAFSGGGSDDRWEAMLTADRPLATDTNWLELSGQPIALVERRFQVTVEVESLREADPALRHLWRQVALSEHSPPEHALGASIEALTAAGALDPEDPVIELRHRVGDRVPGRLWGASQTGVVRGAPEPWPGLLRRAGHTDGPRAAIVVGAVTPAFDGHFVAVYCLESEPDSFSINAAVSPPEIEHHPGQINLDDHPLVWWARDDRGNRYLGHWRDSSANVAVKSGTIAFSPALDPLAERLELLPTGLDARAVITFPLLWDGEAT